MLHAMEDWYGGLDSRVLDLVSDYAGRELFCLEGDSLVLECLDDSRLDFEYGFQLLHAVYMVERFLARLLPTKCSFHIVFFEENREIVPSAASKDIYRSKYGLAREIIYQHLSTHLQARYPEIQVVQFPAIRSPEFRSYIQAHNVYFVMCHNGALRKSNAPTVGSMLYAIHDVMACGLDVAVINEIEWRDVKIMTKVIQAKAFKPLETESKDEGHETESAEKPCWATEYASNLQILVMQEKDSLKSSLTMREVLTLSALSHLILKTPNDETKCLACYILFHLASLNSLSLTERRLEVPKGSGLDTYNAFLDRYCQASIAILRSSEWKIICHDVRGADIHDFIDGRLLRSCMSNTSWANKSAVLSMNMEGDCHALLRCYQDISDFVIRKESKTKNEKPAKPVKAIEDSMTLLPFEHRVFDEHLASVRVKVQDSDPEPYENAIQDKTHWHNRGKLGPKPVTSLRGIHVPQKRTKRNNSNRWNQTWSREMERFAKSLTNPKGSILEQQLIISPELRKEKPKGKDVISAKGKKFASANEVMKITKEEASSVGSWKTKLGTMKSMELHLQVEESQSYIEKLDNRKKTVLETEIRLYLLSLLVEQWQSCRTADQRQNRIAFATQVWEQVRILRKKVDQMTAQCYREFWKVCQKLCVTDTPQPSCPLSNRSLSFSPRAKLIKSEQLGAPHDFQEFQLLHCGPLMDRQTGAKPDSRVPFEPDQWQRDVLDELDEGNSIFVVAPTSAGKTFISFHAISQVLQEDDTGVLVYVAPTKALVNQIAAEIHARFKKTYPRNPKQNFWAILTRDLWSKDPLKCQVLVTVPHILQIMLLTPANARTWAPRVKCIIFDEIHSIGQAHDGLVWEQLLLLAPCRIIALSATVGNPADFADWLSCTQRSLGIDLKLIQYGQRYSDLRKHFYTPPEDFSFKGLARAKNKGVLEAGLVGGLQSIHPLTTLLNQMRQMPEDLSFEPRDCYVLWQCMLKHASGEFPVPEELHPKHSMPSFIRRSDVFVWERRLKGFLSAWMINPKSPFEKVRRELESTYSPASQSSSQDIVKMEKETMCTSVFPLLVDLHHQGAMPALLFNYERTTCEQIATSILTQLRVAEDAYKGGPAWKKKISDYEKYQVSMVKRACAAEKRKPSSQDEATPDQAEHEHSPFDTFYPDRPLEQFTFANPYAYEWGKMKDEIEFLGKSKINPILLEALQRGIGVHHAGLNRRYRHCVERLFRQGFLRVVVATGTLALGINMPCSTVIFCGDGVFLTPLNYRQASGRAGRRGFDLLGNVIFHGIPRHKAYQLMSSRLPDLNGHFPITTSLVLRLCILLNNSEDSPYAVRAINALLSQPRLCFGGAESKEKVLHHLRFSIEYLRRQRLLGCHGQPVHLAQCVAHLYYTENSAFAFHALLREGYFENLCRTNRNNSEKKVRTLIIVLAHLFGRISLGKHYEFLEHKQEIESPSAVCLPEIPPDAAKIIRKHNQEILKTYTAYVTTYIEQHFRTPETDLPLTKIPAGGPGNPALSQSLKALEPTHYRSPFVALSGHDDKFKNIKDLCQTVRFEVFIEECVIPHLTVPPDGDMLPLNAYLYDFFRHGCLEPLEIVNHISRSDSWYLLNDFSLVLATIIAALEVHLDPSLEEGPDLIDSLGVEDYSEDEGDDGDGDDDGNKAGDLEQDSGQTKQKPVSDSKLGSSTNSPEKEKPNPAPIPSKSNSEDDDKVPDNWDDDEGESNDHNNTKQNCINENTNGKEPEKNDESDTQPQTQDEPLVVSWEVLNAFRELKSEFDKKFHAIFA